MIDMTVDLGGLKMRTPVTTASGTFGYGTEYVGAVDYAKLGAVTVKGIRRDPWPGNPLPRHVEVFGGLVNAIGLQGPGVEAFVSHYVKHYVKTVAAEMAALHADAINCVPPLIVNIWGGSVEEYAEVAARLTQAGAPVAAIECNVSCPNVKEGGHTFGHDVAVLEKVVGAVRKATKKPLFVKLAPNVPDIAPYAKACEDCGADALSLINTIPAMVIDVESRKYAIANRSGGLSGRAVHPVAVKAVHDASRAVKLPILAMGGVYGWRDAVELMLAGATAVAVGTALFTNPSVVSEVYDGMADYCRRHSFDAVSRLTGAINGE